MFGLSSDFIAVTLVSLFTIVNPLGATPLFLSHTSNLSGEEVGRIAKRASIACFCVLTIFALSGNLLFKLMGISIPAFRIAGGFLVFGNAWNMLRGANLRSRTLPEEQKEAHEKEDISIIPLAIPLLSGPGAITTVIVLMTRAKQPSQDAFILFSIFVVSVATYFILRRSSYLIRIIGQSGVRVMTRLMGMVLAAISVQFIINGLKDLIPEFAKLIG